VDLCGHAALSHDIGSDSQRLFAIVIVGGLITDLMLSVFLLPTLYVWIACPDDKLPSPEEGWRGKQASCVRPGFATLAPQLALDSDQ
jgi:hypothetical protein